MSEDAVASAEEEALPWVETSVPPPREPERVSRNDEPCFTWALPDERADRRADAAAAIDVARAFLDEVRELRSVTVTRKTVVLEQLKLVQRELVREHLSTLPIERIKDATEGRLRLGALRQAGYTTVAHLLQVSPSRLVAVPGVGEQTATQVVAAARHLAQTVEETVPLRLDVDKQSSVQTALLAALSAYGDAQRMAEPLMAATEGAPGELSRLIDAAEPATKGKIRWLFTGGRRRESAVTAADDLFKYLSAAQSLGGRVAVALHAVRIPTVNTEVLWRDFAARAPEYYGLLGELADIKLDLAAVHGDLPAELAEQVSNQVLDTSWLTVSLRGYQAFGAKFGLVQRRVILGDEMGLGKTIEAIAVMAHLAALGATHFLVVCPASVLVNWTREITARSKLRGYRIHGAERDIALAAWWKRGGVGVTTFGTLRHCDPPDGREVAALVVDEAHYVKNPTAQRSREVTRWAHEAGRVVFLTGTPMENRVDEFRSLVHYLQPEIAARVDKSAGLVGAAHFRSTVAPAYLRRNQEDVLSELPERLDAEDWVDLTEHDEDYYRRALLERNFMAMRRASLLAGPGKSAKLERLQEIIEESADNGWKVVVFSYFLDVLRVVSGLSHGRLFGPLTGKVSPTARQAMVDEFSAASGHALLLSQIQAGGTGLNMQAASVVVLTEPQWKPSIEEQAIARCHRMGQVRRVHVHRLLAQDSVDQRMLEILREKGALFDEYVRRSALKEVSPDAVDIADGDATKRAVSFAEMEHEIIDRERERLGIRLSG